MRRRTRGAASGALAAARAAHHHHHHQEELDAPLVRANLGGMPTSATLMATGAALFRRIDLLHAGFVTLADIDAFLGAAGART